jgi:arsenate reductase-like glutaredoxin family protein
VQESPKWLERFGIPHTFIDYREQPQSARYPGRLEGAGGWLGPDDQQVVDHVAQPVAAPQGAGSEAEWKLLLREYPQLIRRPVVVADDGVVSQGFSDSGFKKRFGVDR